MQLEDYSTEAIQAELDSRKPSYSELEWKIKKLEAKLEQLEYYKQWWEEKYSV